MAEFTSTLVQMGNNTGIEVPDEIIAALGGGKKPKVNVTVNGFAYRSSVAVMGGKYLISFSSDKRAATGLKGGDPIAVTLELDTAPREIEVPADFAAALAEAPAAEAFFKSLSYSNQSRHVLAIADAKTDETRRKRIAKAVDALKAGEK